MTGSLFVAHRRRVRRHARFKFVMCRIFPIVVMTAVALIGAWAYSQ